MIFTVYGEPQGKGRPRFHNVNGHGYAYTPPKTREYEQEIRLAFEREMPEGFKIIKGAVEIKVRAVFSVPVKDTKAEAKRKLAGVVKPCKKPDIDNIEKVVMDALIGVVYDDDKQVCKVTSEKIYGAEPRLIIELDEMRAAVV